MALRKKPRYDVRDMTLFDSALFAYILTLCHTIPTFNYPKKKNPLKNVLRKGENAGNQHFFPFPTMFSTLPKTNFNFLVIFMLLSANAFNLDMYEKSSFGKSF